MILLGIEHLEQRRSGIAAEVLAELVDLVEQEQRVRGPALRKLVTILPGSEPM